MEGTIQWFPGHMAKTKRKLKESLPLVDAVAEIIDARIPLSSRNPDLDGLVEGKPRLVVMNKADLADEAASRKWERHFAQAGITAMTADCKSGKGLNRFPVLLRDILAPQIAAWEAKGMVGRPVRAMVVGIPNAGKSSFINRLARGGRAKVEDRPGVTRGNQWFAAEGGVQLLDTPGVLWPKFDDQAAARRLAYTGAIKDELLDGEELAAGLLESLARDYEPLLCARYKLGNDLPADGWELLERIGRKRGMLVSGGEVDTQRAAAAILDDFRGGKIGRITLEFPQ